MIVPEDINADISPREFEELVRDYLIQQGEPLKSFVATHDIKLKGPDGEYQIDVFAEFEYLGVNFKVLVECKRYSSRIKREAIQILYDKLRAIGAQKGILFSTSDFQEGARKYAKAHGIALIRVIEGRYTYSTKSHGAQHFQVPDWVNFPKYVGEFKNGSAVTYLQKGCLENLNAFLFGDDSRI
ncbi:restriction endonuclease [Hymenobacter ruber]